jgi:hypothetical protein
LVAAVCDDGACVVWQSQCTVGVAVPGLAMVNMPVPEASGAREILLTILPPPSFGYLHPTDTV